MSEQLYSIDRITLGAGEVRTIPGSYQVVGCYQMVTTGGQVLASVTRRENSGGNHRFVLDPGLYVGPFPFDEITLENANTGAPVTFDLLRSQARVIDNRLVLTSASVVHVDDNGGSLTIDSAQLPAALDANGRLKVSSDDYTLPAVSTHASLDGNGAAAATATLVTAVANVNGIRIYRGAHFMWCGAPGQCHLFGDNGAVLHIAGGLTRNNTVPSQQTMADDVILPAGFALKATTEGQFAYEFNYKVL